MAGVDAAGAALALYLYSTSTPCTLRQQAALRLLSSPSLIAKLTFAPTLTVCGCHTRHHETCIEVEQAIFLMLAHKNDEQHVTETSFNLGQSRYNYICSAGMRYPDLICTNTM